MWHWNDFVVITYACPVNRGTVFQQKMQSKTSITVVGCHAEGEVGRVITGGVLPPQGETLAAQKDHLRKNNDDLRQFLIFEPRGGAFVHCNLIVPARNPSADVGFIVMEPNDYPPMSGSNSVCVATVLLETGMVPMREPVTRFTLEAPGGLVQVEAQCCDGKCKRVKVTNLPSFVFRRDAMIEVEGLGSLRCDIAFGGDTFAIFDANNLGFSLSRDEARDLVESGETLKAAVNQQTDIQHPEIPTADFVSFVQFAGPLKRPEGNTVTAKNTVVISPGKLDRSPCGTGSCARMAVLHARGELHPGQTFISKSILDTEFLCRIEDETRVGNYSAILPSLSGRAWITGVHQYLLDPEDPFPQGCTLSDTWYRTLGPLLTGGAR